ncbi:hypothetical protein E4U30_007418 [Claviceps sp. LM220 group G6]|nr:hypothetical protein E4U30_007418 [Claviceps sp. LM220 group G6]
MIMSRQAADRQEAGPSEATHGSKSLVDRYATIEAAPGAEFRDAHQAIRLGARRAGLCAPLKDVDNEDEGELLECITGNLKHANATTLQSVVQGAIWVVALPLETASPPKRRKGMSIAPPPKLHHWLWISSSRRTVEP